MIDQPNSQTMTTELTGEASGDTISTTEIAANPKSVSGNPIADPQGNLIIDGIDLNALRINPNTAMNVSVKPVITSVAIMKPNPKQFIRVCATRAGFPYSAMAVDGGQGIGFYLVTNGVDQLVPQHVKAYSFHLAINRANQLFLIPLNEHRTNGHRHSSADSLELALEQAKRAWVQISWNSALMGYQVYEAVGNLAEPIWPTLTDNEIFNLAFKGRIIQSATHPIIQGLQGAA